jgi:hypothetical protein
VAGEELVEVALTVVLSVFTPESFLGMAPSRPQGVEGATEVTEARGRMMLLDILVLAVEVGVVLLGMAGR